LFDALLELLLHLGLSPLHFGHCFGQGFQIVFGVVCGPVIFMAGELVRVTGLELGTLW
jgi:hypothetical protein